jgi:hypothetical protein
MSAEMKIYQGRRESGGCVIKVYTQPVVGNAPFGQPHSHYGLTPGRSLRLRNHSPTGFEWGYGGSGPAQTALAILLDHCGDEKLALTFYQDFKADAVARMPGEWELTQQEVALWLLDRMRGFGAHAHFKAKWDGAREEKRFPCSAFRVRQPLPFGRYEVWPTEYATLADAIREVDRVGNTAVEIINGAGEVVIHSKLWWKKHGKDGRP